MRGQVKIYQKKLKEKRRKRVFLISLYTFAALVLIACGLSYLSGLEYLSLGKIEVEGNIRVSEPAITSIVLNDIKGNYLGLFAKRNILLYPQEEIRKDIEALPAVKSANVTRKDATTLLVTLNERKKSSEWCSGKSGDTSDCYSLDDNGFVFAKEACATTTICIKDSPGTTTSDGVIFRGSIENDPIGQHFLDPAGFKKIRFFMGELGGLSVDPREAVVTGTTTPVYMTILLGGGGRLVVNTGDDLSAVLGNIASVVSDRAIAPSLSNFLDNLDYMKLDIGNKVVYKLKQ